MSDTTLRRTTSGSGGIFSSPSSNHGLAMVLAVLTVCSMAAVTSAEVVQLDISSGFNTDNWIGVKEYQAVWNSGTSVTDLMQAQNGSPVSTARNAASSAWFATNQLGTMVCAIDNATAQSLGCVPDGEGGYYGYVYGATPSSNGYKDSTEATPIDGVLTSSIDGRVYHIASHAGNATLSGDWTEVANPSYTGSGDDVTVLMESKLNTMTVVTAFNSADRQTASVEATLSVGQQGYYEDINFVLGCWSGMSDRGLNTRIIAVYDDGEETLYTYNTDSGNPVNQGPLSATLTNEDTDFTLIHAASQGYNNGYGNYGIVNTDQPSALYEFTTPLDLDETRLLTGIKLVDINPSLNWNGRGVSVFGASATLVPEPTSLGLLGLGCVFLARKRRR